MKKPSQFLSLGAALLLAPLTPTFAQSTWATVDDFQQVAGLAERNPELDHAHAPALHQNLNSSRERL